jgi:hypothetical protein
VVNPIRRESAPDDVVPASPDEAGVAEAEPELTEVEPARLLANDARARLRADGFADTDIDAWAKTFVNDVGASATVEEFIAWIARRERT